MFTTITRIKLPTILKNILLELNNLGYLPLIVGGCVRDTLLKKEIKDYDIEVFNLDSLNSLAEILSKYSNVNFVGKNFCVLKIKYKKYDFDFSLPRTEKKIGLGHKDYIVKINSNSDYKQAALRRDITINSIAYNFFTKEFIDPYGGILDLKNKEIKKINSITFVEDSLRVYRCIQFASRFEFKIENETKKLCKEIIENGDLEELSKERIYEEYKKMFLKSKKPSIALNLLKELNIISIENDNFDNIDKLAFILKNKHYDDNRKLYIFFACFYKMFKKNEALLFLNSITNNKIFLNNVVNLAEAKFSNSIKVLKQMSLKLKLEDYLILNYVFNKKISKNNYKELKKIKILNKKLVNKISGKDLIKMGYKPSRKFNKILDYSFSLQIKENYSKTILKKHILKKYEI